MQRKGKILVLRQSLFTKGFVSVFFKLFVVAFTAVFLLCITMVVISTAICDSVSERVFISAEELDSSVKYDCVIVLGAGLKKDGTPSHMLEDRIKVGVEVMRAIGCDKILMSGDRSGDYYDEPAAMEKYAVGMGVESSDILVDEHGFSTYESIMRAKSEYGFDRIVIITQEYHLYRALYIADSAGIDAVGVSADLRPYRNQIVRDVREILARTKDFFITN